MSDHTSKTSDPNGDSSGGPGSDAPVLFERRGALGRVVLNRPKAINALTTPMVTALHEQLQAWADDDTVRAVSLEGAGPMGLCAGGDMRAVRESALAGDDAAMTFFTREYAVDGLVARYPKPFVALMDGVVMGGGVGLSAFGALRLVTGSTRFAMPETAIGFFPDVGVRYLLARAPGELGTHLALTGSPVDGADAIAAGFADAQIDAATWEGLLDRLAAGETLDASVGEVPLNSLAEARSWIDPCYAGDDPVAIVHRLEARPEPAARAAAEVVRSRSPLAVAVALAGIRRAADAVSVDQVLDEDLGLAARYVEDSDLAEGVRDVLVDKGRGAPPRWRYDRLEDVPHEVVAGFFR